MHTVGHHGLSDPFGRSNEPWSEHTPHFDDFRVHSTSFFGWSGFRRKKCQIFLWTSVKTLSMHTVGHHSFYDPFGSSNEPRSEHTPHFDDFRVLLHTIFWVIPIPMSKMPNFSWTSVKTFSMHTVGHHSLCYPFGRSNEPRSEPNPHFDDFHVL